VSADTHDFTSLQFEFDRSPVRPGSETLLADAGGKSPSPSNKWDHEHITAPGFLYKFYRSVFDDYQ